MLIPINHGKSRAGIRLGVQRSQQPTVSILYRNMVYTLRDKISSAYKGAARCWRPLHLRSVRNGRVNRIVSIEDVTPLFGGTELDAHAALAIVGRLPRPSAANVALEVLRGTRVPVGMAVLVLHAVLTDIAEPGALAVLGGPGIVEGVAEAVGVLDCLNDAPGRGTLHDSGLLPVMDVDDVAYESARMAVPVRGRPCLSVPILLLLLVLLDVLELRRQVMVAALGIGPNARADQFQRRGGGQRQLQGGAFRLIALGGGGDLGSERVGERVKRVVGAAVSCRSNGYIVLSTVVVKLSSRSRPE